MTAAPAFAIVTVETDTGTLIHPDSAFTARQRAAIAHIVANRGVDPLPAEAPARSLVTDQLAPPHTPSPSDGIRRKAMTEAARGQGYTGDVCQNLTCGGMRVRRNGSCLCCDDCGQTTGCS